MNEITQAETVKKVDIKCPNCNMLYPHEYTNKTYCPVYSKCNFCSTLFVWKKMKTIEIVPADRKYQLTIVIDSSEIVENN